MELRATCIDFDPLETRILRNRRLLPLLPPNPKAMPHYSAKGAPGRAHACVTHQPTGLGCWVWRLQLIENSRATA